MPERPQAVIRLVPSGGARTAKQIYSQWVYLSRKGEVQLQRCARHFGVMLAADQLWDVAQSWAVETGQYQGQQPSVERTQELTTHIVVSFPRTTPAALAFATGRAWAEEMFGSGRNGGSFDYLTACHTDRAHPHMHLVINRRALEGHWLKISRRHAYLNYDRLRSTLVDVAARNGILLEATSRVERGIAQPPITYAEYRRRARRSAGPAGDQPGA